MDVVSFMWSYCRRRVENEIGALVEVVTKVPAQSFHEMLDVRETLDTSGQERLAETFAAVFGPQPLPSSIDQCLRSLYDQLSKLCASGGAMSSDQYRTVVTISKVIRTHLATNVELRQLLDGFCSRESDMQAAVENIKSLYDAHIDATVPVSHRWLFGFAPTACEAIQVDPEIITVLRDNSRKSIMNRMMAENFRSTFSDLVDGWSLQKPIALQLHPEVRMMLCYVSDPWDTDKEPVWVGTSRGSCYACKQWPTAYGKCHTPWIFYPSASQAASHNWASPCYILPELADNSDIDRAQGELDGITRRFTKQLIKTHITKDDE